MQKRLFDTFFRQLKGETFAVTYWDGETETYCWKEREEEPLFRLMIKEKLDLTSLLTQPELQLGEAYMDGRIDLEGDLRDLFVFAMKNREEKDVETKKGLLKSFIERQRKTSKEDQVKGVKAHYDLGNAFFSLWLDDTMSYSCGYFRDPYDSLKKAQLQKIDYVLKKIDLKPGETLLDIGSGWGHLIIKAAKEYGTKALGVTLSKEQYRKTRQEIEDEGLEGEAEVRLEDYQKLPGQGHSFDKIVSIGMFEHVGKEHISTYFETIDELLVPGGLSLLHTITHPLEDPSNPWLEKYIFPWGYIPSVREVVWELPEHSFQLLDVENLRRHYALTTDHWARNFEESMDDLIEEYGERFVRMWHLFLVGCTTSFQYTSLAIHQFLFSKGINNSLPLTREPIYRDWE